MMDAQTTSIVNKSHAIREVLASGTTKPKEVVAAVKQRFDLEVSANLVYKLKQNLNKRPVRRAKLEKLQSDKPIEAAIQLIKVTGGISEAKELLRQLEQVKSVLDRSTAEGE